MASPTASTEVAQPIDEWHNVLEFMEVEWWSRMTKPLYAFPEPIRKLSNGICASLLPSWSPPYFLNFHMRQKFLNRYLRENYPTVYIDKNKFESRPFLVDVPYWNDPFLAVN
eukprot:TRINITY_DN57791_c0_g1_i1.p3 TRINITY_DN57791_c0_g1~~TRINITY_DN57791_c0_g1_i1.p3  ORF type:complete len:112 (-),score=17.04 TRINITY_DN57791_c0_g1_i1:330-665(-)